MNPKPPARRTPLGTLRITHRSEAPPAVPPDALTLYIFDPVALGAELDPLTAEVGRPALAAWWAEQGATASGAFLAVTPDTSRAALVAGLRAAADALDDGSLPAPDVASVWAWRRAFAQDTHESMARPGVLPPPMAANG